MAELEGMDLYFAGVEDAKMAKRHARRLTSKRRVTKQEFDRLVGQELQHILDRRIARGEIRPTLDELYGKAS